MLLKAKAVVNIMNNVSKIDRDICVQVYALQSLMMLKINCRAVGATAAGTAMAVVVLSCTSMLKIHIF